MLVRYSRNGGPVHREGCGVPQNGTPRATIHLHRRPPSASTCDCSSTGSCSSSLHRALLHRLLFNQPSPRGPVQPPLHGLLFIQPSTGYYSTSHPRAPVHPALHGLLFIHPQPARSGSCSSSGNGLYYHGVLFIQPQPGTVHPTPQQHSLFIKRQQVQLASVSSSSKGIARSGSVNRQIDRSLGFSNA